MSKNRKETYTEIFRETKANNYSIISNEVLRREDLSWKAKGIMTYILSLPPDWKIYLEEVAQHATDGMASFRTGWNELKSKGYVERHPIREGNRIVAWRTIVRERVFDDEGNLLPGIQQTQEPADDSLLTENQQVEETLENLLLTDFQQVENLQVGNEDVENRKLLSTYSTKDLITNLNNKNKGQPEDGSEPEKPSDENQDQKTERDVHLFYQQNIHHMEPPIVAEDLDYWVADLSAEVVIYALQLTAENNAKYSYTKSILQDWAQQGVKTLEQAKMEAATRKQQQKQARRPKNYNQRAPKVEQLPEWAKKKDNPNLEQKKGEEIIPAEQSFQFQVRLYNFRTEPKLKQEVVDTFNRQYGEGEFERLLAKWEAKAEGRTAE